MTWNQPLTLASCMSPSSDFFYEWLAEYLSRRLDLDVRWVDRGGWQDRLRAVCDGDISLAAICGLHYVNETGNGHPRIQPIAAAVPAAPRYGTRPVYFTELLVRADGPCRSFDCLAGARWAYNEPTSQSGFGIIAFELARRGLSFDFFSSALESGSHIESLRLLLEGRVDVISIDSTVLELEVARSPGLARLVRSVASFGPSPFPPIVAGAGVPPDLRQRLRHALIRLDEDAAGSRLLHEAMLRSLAPVDDGTYDSVRSMQRTARAAGLHRPPMRRR